MSFRESFYQVKELLVDRLQEFGLDSASMNMGWTSLLSIQQTTRVTINVPLNLVYSDAFLISGTLENANYSRISGKTVKLKVGNTVVDTTVTDSNGEYSFTQTPVSTGTHSFQVVFEGAGIYSSSQSSTVTRTVDHETSVMNLNTVPVQHYGNTAVLSGTLLTDDGEYIKQATVKYYEQTNGVYTLVDTLTTDNYGVFSINKQIESFDSTLAKFEYEGDSNYTASSITQTITVYQMILDLSSDKSILSYIDGESATLTAQIKDNGNQNLAFEGEHLLFYVEEEVDAGFYFSGTEFSIDGTKVVADGDVIVDWGDGTTSTNEFTHTYASEGDYFITFTGDITSFGDSCFYNIRGLTSVILPDSVTKLGRDCFDSCTNLTSVILPDSLTVMSLDCFQGCSNLEEVIIPESLTTLGVQCFLYCHNLTSIIIPNTVTWLHSYCLYGTGLTAIVIPSSVTTMDDGCFGGCENLIDVQLNWKTGIPTYNSTWFDRASSDLMFSIPAGTRNAYISKGYPSAKLVERGDD